MQQLRQGGLDVARTFIAVIAVPAAGLFLAALAACGGDGERDAGSNTGGGSGAQAGRLFPDNFKGVCSGASVSTATAYDPAATAHKALYFAPYEEDLMDR